MSNKIKLTQADNHHFELMFGDETFHVRLVKNDSILKDYLIFEHVEKEPLSNKIRLLSNGVNEFVLCLGDNNYYIKSFGEEFMIDGTVCDHITFDETVKTTNEKE